MEETTGPGNVESSILILSKRMNWRYFLVILVMI